MSANKVYYPAVIGGRILGVQLAIQNTGATDLTALATNGVFYCFEGKDYQLLSLNGVTIPAGETIIINEEFREYMIPTSDIKIMIDSAGMVDCILTPIVLWGV